MILKFIVKIAKNILMQIKLNFILKIVKKHINKKK